MPTPASEAVELRRSDTVASDVSASKHHLSERAEVERRASDIEARNSSVAADSNVEASETREQPVEEATRTAAEGETTAAEEEAMAAKTKVALEVSPVPEVGKQSNVIKAERTDHASWDVHDRSNVTSFCCCFERPAKEVGR